MARTQAVFYRDERGAEPVDDFIEALPPKHAAKIDDYIEEYLNARRPDEPPPEYPISSQLDGELRELRVRFASTRYRILYQRSDNLVVLLHAHREGHRRRAGRGRRARKASDDRLQTAHGCRKAPTPARRRTGRATTPRPSPLTKLIEIDKVGVMSAKAKALSSPAGQAASDAAKRRATRSEAYREARDEYAAIRELRERNWIAAHIRERRYELDLTQQEVAERAGTSHSFISKLEGGAHIPTIPVLQRILAVLDEELLIGIQPRGAEMEAEREVAPVPEPATA